MLVSCDLAWEEEARVTTTGSERIAWYKAFCSSVYDADREILLGAHAISPRAPIVPYDSDPLNPARLVAECYPRRISGSTWFDVQVTYSSDVTIEQNPLNEPAAITIKGQRREVVSLFDSNGLPKMNTAGDLLGDPVPTKPVTDLIISVSKNVSLSLPAWILDYVDTVNSDTVRIRGLIFPPGTLCFAGDVDVGEELNTESINNGVRQIPYTTVGFQLHYRAEGWTTLIPNRGFYQLVPRSATAAQVVTAAFKTKKPMPLSLPKFPYDRQRILVGTTPPDYPDEPQFLDPNGAFIENPTPDQIVVLEFDDYDKLPFGQLPLK